MNISEPRPRSSEADREALIGELLEEIAELKRQRGNDLLRIWRGLEAGERESLNADLNAAYQADQEAIKRRDRLRKKMRRNDEKKYVRPASEAPLNASRFQGLKHEAEQGVLGVLQRFCEQSGFAFKGVIVDLRGSSAVSEDEIGPVFRISLDARLTS